MTESLRVLQVCNRFLPCPGGIPYHVSDLAVSLAMLGHEVDVLSPRCGKMDKNHDSELEILKTHGVHLIDTPRMNLPLAYFHGILPSIRLWHFLHSHEYDIVHFHSWPTLLTDLGVRLAHLVRNPVVLTIHGFGPPKGSFIYELMYTFLENRVLHGTIDKTARVISVSHAGIEYLSNFTEERSKIVCIPNGIWLNTLPEIMPEGYRDRLSTFLFVGRFTTAKGVNTLMDAFSVVAESCPRTQLVLVGEGSPDQITYLKRCAKALGIENRMRIITNQRRRDICRKYSPDSILVLPSTREGLPSVILEAFAKKSPVIASDIGGVRELVQDEVTGILVPPGSVTQLAEAMIRLFNDQELRKRLTMNAFEKVQDFDWTHLGRAVEQIYFQALSSEV